VLKAIDHVIVAVGDPDQAARELEELVGLVASGGGRHDAHGTFNRLFWMGDSYVELMGVFDLGLAGRSWWGQHVAGTLANGSDGQAGLVLATDDLAGDLARLRGLGATLGDPSAGERRRPDGDVVRWWSARLPAPDPDVGLMFLIEHDLAAAEWRAEDRAARAASEMPGVGRVRLLRVELPVGDVARVSLRLLRTFGLQFRPSLAGGGTRDATIGSQTLRLVRAARGRRATVVMRGSAVAEPRQATALGCTWIVEPGGDSS